MKKIKWKNDGPTTGIETKVGNMIKKMPFDWLVKYKWIFIQQ